MSWPVACGAIVAVALLVRVVYLLRLSQSPLAGSLTLDAVLYWGWSGHLLEHGPIGTKPFFFGPLYPYVLSALRLVVGGDVGRVLFVQAVWGALACGVLADAARRLTTAGVGIGVGLWAAIYEPCIFFDGLVLMESLLFFVGVVFLWWVVRADQERPRVAQAFVAGALLGLLACGRAVVVVVALPLFALWLHRAGRGAARGILACVAGLSCVIAPVALRNLVVGGEFIPLTYNLGYNLYVGNGPAATGAYVRITGTHDIEVVAGGAAEGGGSVDGREYLRRTRGLDFTPAASSTYWAKQAMASVAADPGRALGLAARKVGMLWNRREYPQIESIEAYRGAAGPIGLPVVGTFLVLGPLALAGAWVAWRAGGVGRFLVAYPAMISLGVAPFFVTDRYRHHLIPALFILAAFALERLAKRRNTAPILWGLVAGALVVNLPAPAMSSARYEWGLAYDLGSRWLERNRPELAFRALDRAITLERRGLVRRRAGDATLAAEHAALYHAYAAALSRLGRSGEALPWLERAASAAPENGAILAALASAYRSAARIDDAHRVESRMESVAGGWKRVLEGRAWREAQAGSMSVAESLFAQVVARDPESYDSWTALVRLQAQRGRLTEASATLERARAAGLPSLPAHAHEGMIAALAGDRATAERALSELSAREVGADPVLAEVARVIRAALDRKP